MKTCLCINSKMEYIQEHVKPRVFSHKQRIWSSRTNEKQGRVNSYIPNNEKVRQRPVDEKLRSDLEWQSWSWKVNWSQASFLKSKDWWQSRKWHEPRQGEWQDQKNGKYCLSAPSTPLQESCIFVIFDISRTDATGGEDSTPRTRDTDAHFSRVAHMRHIINAHPLAQDRTVKNMWIVGLCVLIKRHSFVSCFVVRYLSHSSLRPIRSTPPLTQTSLANMGMSMTPCVTPQGGLLFGRMAEQSLTSNEPKSFTEVSSEHTADQYLIEQEQLQHRLQRSRDHGGCI